MVSSESYLTTAVHAGVRPEATYGAVVTPIYQTSTYAQSEPAVHKGYDYSRGGNPTRTAYEEGLAQLEGARYGLSFSSGLAAEQAIIQTLDPGAHVVVCDDVYGGTGRLFRKLFAKYNLEFSFIDMSDSKNVAAAMTAKTKLVWVESPTNPTLKIIDIVKVAALAKARGALTVVDNTFATPIFQSPLKLGADIVVHSTTKYISGHSDLIGGALMTNDEGLEEKLRFIQFAAGAVPGPMDAYLFHRSIKTLAIRMRQHDTNALQVARALEGNRRIKRVYYPGLPSHPQHTLAKEQMRGFSGIVSFDMAGDYDDVVKFLKRLKIFTLAESLGAVESLVNHPEKMTHASVPPELRAKLGIGPTLIRLSVGIEEGGDLVADLHQALNF